IAPATAAGRHRRRRRTHRHRRQRRAGARIVGRGPASARPRRHFPAGGKRNRADSLAAARASPHPGRRRFVVGRRGHDPRRDPGRRHRLPAQERRRSRTHPFAEEPAARWRAHRPGHRPPHPGNAAGAGPVTGRGRGAGARRAGADAARDRHPATGGARPEQPRDRRGDRPVPADHRKPYKEHLPQARGAFAHRGGVPGAGDGVARLIPRLRLLLACLLLLASVAPAIAAPSPPGILHIESAEAVRAGWDSHAPPADGWVPVTLLDDWTTRWPEHDGVVWYRVRWRQAGTAAPVGLLVDYACMASAVYVNGSLVARDRSLAEPLSRGWIKPRYLLLDAPLLRDGENTLLVRVSGLAAYQPGFGAVAVGDPALVQARYQRGLFQRFQIKLVNTAMSAVLGAIFLLIWLLRRQDTTYGWFALSELFGAAYSANYIVTSPWPFATTDAWQAF